MQLVVNRLHFPVTTLGPGRRIGIWLQGCSIGCPGCVARDTWDRSAGTSVTVEELLRRSLRLADSGTTGITISGGEPFEQPDGLIQFLQKIRRSEPGQHLDILCYSGYAYRTLQARWPSVLELLDAVIPGPFIEDLPRGKVWRGSRNQPLIPLTPLGVERFTPFLDMEYQGKGMLQVQVERDRIFLIGIPDRHDVGRLEGSLRLQGVVPVDPSWGAD